ncbi:hypothetical protein IRT38_04555 [Acinetobacter sp. SK-43]|uniref:hypothetical protein n=1 Tax=Acinetobacter sp. SK-43 TaxID=2785295 RepID=UPI00188C74C5|nr:hypothetical protein [Acinetobacter sp. SK-43]MBF4454668.1 hypothetical protein [Acinetobacter sp. SK-43]
MKYKLKVVSIIVCFIILILFLYSSIFSAQYVWDDALLFVNKTGLVEEPLTWTLISGPVLPNTSYFRPFVFLTWYCEFHIFGLNPIVSHTIGLIIFIINNLLLFLLSYLFAKRLDRSQPLVLASIATLLYLTHPALIESTAWVSGRFDQLCTLFSLVALLVFIKYFKNSEISLSWSASITIGFSFLCALLSKEVAIWMPIILFIFYIILEPNISYLKLIKNAIFNQYKLIFTFILFFLIYLLLRLSSVSYNSAIFNRDYMQIMILDGILPLHAIKYYLLQIFLPFSHVSLLSPLEQLDQSLFSRSIAYISGILILLIFYLAIYKRHISALLSLCAFIYLFLVLYFIPVGIANNLGHSRFLTLPMIFVVLAIVFLPYTKIFKNLKISYRKVVVLGTIVVVFWLGFSILTVKTVAPFWLNEYTLWYWAYQTHPDSKLARSNYLSALVNKKKFDEVIKISNQYIEKHNALEVGEQITYATALLNKNDPESLDYFKGVISVLPKLHEENNAKARQKADYFLLSSAQMSDAYTLYALALIKFKGDVEGAIQNLKIAEWYLLDDQKEQFNYYLVAVLYINQQYKQALDLYHQQKEKTLKRGGNAYIYTPAIIGQYCQGRENMEACQRFAKEQF